MNIFPASIVFAVAFAEMSFAQARFKDGSYVREHESGSLDLRQNEVTINTINSMTNICDLKGKLVDGVVTAESSSPDKVCKLKLKTKEVQGVPVVEVEVEGDTLLVCNEFCGLNGDLTGDFYIVKKECSATSIDQSRAQFKTSFDKKQYREAILGMESKLKECNPYITREKFAWMKSDLALAHFRAGDKAACLREIASVEKISKPEKLEKALKFNKDACEGKTKSTLKKKS